MKHRVGIIGKGNVGSALHRGLERAGYGVRSVGKEPAQVRETGSWAEIIILPCLQPETTRTPRRRSSRWHEILASMQLTPDPSRTHDYLSHWGT